MGLEQFILWLLKRPYGKPVVALLVIGMGIFFSLLFVPQWQDLRQLQLNHRTTMAEVVDTRVSSGSHGIDSSHDLRYRFRLRDHGPWYYATEKGPLARKELWSTLPKDQWEAARNSGRVEVVYIPADPSVNDLAVNLPRLSTTLYMGAAISLVPLISGSSWLLYLLVRWVSRSSGVGVEEIPWRVPARSGAARAAGKGC